MSLFQGSNKLASSRIRSDTVLLKLWNFKTSSCAFFMQAEVSPPHYDDLLLNWIPPLSMSVIGRRRILKPWFTYLEYSGKLLESPWSFGIIVFSWNAQTALWMLLGAKLDWHVDWVTQHRMHTQNSVCANCTHVYTSCNMCSMDLIKKSVCLSLCTSILSTVKILN